LDFIKQSSFPSCADFKKKLRVNWSAPFFVVTYHPATVGDENPEETFKSLLAALDYFPKYRIIMTYPNADEGSHGLISLAKRYSNLQGNRVKLVKSMGSQLYFSALKYATLVIGNSSSGIIEAPSVGLPTVNIGSRQQGRAAAGSVVNAGTSSSEIVDGIKAGLKLRIKLNFHSLENPYGDGQTGAKIIQLLKSRDFQFKKIFFDLND
jgi:UDP-N-acetylglucosamine 2-epimerase (non-hydrolysing)